MMFVKLGRHFDIYIPRLSVRGLHVLAVLTKYLLTNFPRARKCELVLTLTTIWSFAYHYEDVHHQLQGGGVSTVRNR